MSPLHGTRQLVVKELPDGIVQIDVGGLENKGVKGTVESIRILPGRVVLKPAPAVHGPSPSFT
jgi:hypothetical protein